MEEVFHKNTEGFHSLMDIYERVSSIDDCMQHLFTVDLDRFSDAYNDLVIHLNDIFFVLVVERETSLQGYQKETDDFLHALISFRKVWDSAALYFDTHHQFENQMIEKECGSLLHNLSDCRSAFLDALYEDFPEELKQKSPQYN